MTYNDVVIRVAEVFDSVLKGEDATPHILEDRLHFDVLVAIANDECDSPKACAIAAISTKSVEFPRWYE